MNHREYYTMIRKKCKITQRGQGSCCRPPF